MRYLLRNIFKTESVIFIILVAMHASAVSQNFVPDPGFEKVSGFGSNVAGTLDVWLTGPGTNTPTLISDFCFTSGIPCTGFYFDSKNNNDKVFTNATNNPNSITIGGTNMIALNICDMIMIKLSEEIDASCDINISFQYMQRAESVPDAQEIEVILFHEDDFDIGKEFPNTVFGECTKNDVFNKGHFFSFTNPTPQVNFEVISLSCEEGTIIDPETGFFTPSKSFTHLMLRHVFHGNNDAKETTYIDNVSLVKQDSEDPKDIFEEDINYTTDVIKTACRHIFAGESVDPAYVDGPVLVNNTNVTYAAGESIFLEPGFTAEPTGNNKFKAVIQENCVCIDQPCVGPGVQKLTNIACLGFGLAFNIVGTGPIVYTIKIRNLINQVIFSGSGITKGGDNVVVWNESQFAPGIYSYQLTLLNGCDVFFAGFVNDPPVGFILDGCVGFSKSLNKSSKIVSRAKPSFSIEDENIEEYSSEGIIELSVDPGITEVSVHPNPNQGKFTLTVNSGKSKTYSVQILNTLGYVVHQIEQVNTNELYINRSNLESGCYFVRVLVGDELIVRKVLIN